MHAQDQSTVEVLKSAIHDAQELVRAEVALAKAELRQEVSRVGTGAAALAGAGVAALMAAVFLLTAAAWGIAEAFDWPAWTGFAIVGVLVAAAAAAMAMMGRRRLAGGPHMPKTMETMKENVQWMRTRTS